jgi:hypothetical protein
MTAPAKPATEKCPNCGGHGADPASDNVNWLPCKRCNGTGAIMPGWTNTKPETRTLTESIRIAIDAMSILCMNAGTIPDPRMAGQADTMAVSHEDIEALQGPLFALRAALPQAEAVEALVDAAAESSLAIDAARPEGVGWGRVNLTQSTLRAALHRVRGQS